MKKILFACASAVIVAGGLASCNGGSSAKPGSFDDTVAVTLGETSGSQLLSQYNQLPEDMKSKMSKKDLIEGIEAALKVDTARQGYTQGFMIGSQIANQIYTMEQAGFHISRSTVINAYKKAFMADSVGDMTLIMANNQKVMSKVQDAMLKKQQADMEAEKAAKENSPEAKKNAQAGASYIVEQMKKDPTIIRTPSGLAYKVITEGKGEKAKANSTVTVNYEGKLIDGTVFDSSIQRGEPAKFPVRGVIPGFGEGLQLMGKGAHYILYIPGDIAYGVDGAPQAGIGPNATLVFDVTVEDIDTPSAN